MIKISTLDSVFGTMKVPAKEWDPANVVSYQGYTFSIDNCGGGNIEYKVDLEGETIFYRNDVAGDYEFDDTKVEN